MIDPVGLALVFYVFPLAGVALLAYIFVRLYKKHKQNNQEQNKFKRVGRSIFMILIIAALFVLAIWFLTFFMWVNI